MSEQSSYYSSSPSTEANTPQPPDYYPTLPSTEASNLQSNYVTIPHPPNYPQQPNIGKYIQ